MPRLLCTAFGACALLACAPGTVQSKWAYREGLPTIADHGPTELLEDAQHPPRKCCKGPLAEAQAAGLPKLASVQLPAGDVEVRFWVVPSFGSARGVLLRKDGSDFHALVVDKDGSRVATPSRPWDSTWEALSADGILTLPDDSSLPSDGKYVLDGVGYVVEVHSGGNYRSYGYSNPAEHMWAEATRILHIAHVLARTFQVRIDDRSAAVRARVPDVDVESTSHAIGAPCDSLDMTQSARCGSNGRVAIAIEHGAPAPPCELQPLAPPNPYQWTSCLTQDRVYLASAQYDTLLTGDVAEMTDEQRILLQAKLGLGDARPLRTIAEWRAALRR